MTIKAELADGRVLEFPDGTDSAVIQRTVKRMLASVPSGMSPPSRPALGETIKAGILPLSRKAGSSGLPDFDLSAGITGAIGDALSLPGDVVTGKVQAMSPEAQERTTGLAMLATGLPPASRALRAPIGKPKVPTSEELRAKADTLYEEARASGVIVPQTRVAKVANSMAKEAMEEGLDPTLHPGASAALARVQTLAKGPKTDPMSAITGIQPKPVEITLQQLETARKIVAAPAKNFSNPDEQRIASLMRDHLDEQIDDLMPAELKAARETWQKTRKDELITEAVENAKRNAAASGSGGNINNAIRQAIKAIRNNRRKRSAFTDSELALMDKVINGSAPANLLRLVGKLSPAGNGLMQALNIGAAVGTGGLSVPFSIAAAGVKQLGDASTTKSVRLLAEAVRSGKIPITKLSSAQRAAVGRVLTGAAAGAQDQ